MRSDWWQLKENFNFAVCAAALDFSPTIIENLYHKYSIKGNIDNLPRSGRPPEKNIKGFYTSTRSLSDISHTTIQNYAN